MSASDYTEINHLAHLAGQATYPAMTHTYVSLHTSDPGETSVGALATEVTLAAWPSYARAQAAQGAAMNTGWSTPADSGDGGQQVQNAKRLGFTANNGAGAVTVPYWAIWDAPIGGNLLSSDALNFARIVDVGEAFVFDPNTITWKHK